MPDLEVIVSLFVLGSICTALAYLLFFALVGEVGAGRGTAVTYVDPAIAVFLGVTLLGEPLSAAIIVGFLLIIAGSWLSTGGSLPPPLSHLLRTRSGQQTERDTRVQPPGPFSSTTVVKKPLLAGHLSLIGCRRICACLFAVLSQFFD